MSEHVSSIDVKDLTHIARIFGLASHSARLHVLLALAPAEIDTSRIPEVLHDLDPQVVVHQLAFLHEGGVGPSGSRAARPADLCLTIAAPFMCR